MDRMERKIYMVGIIAFVISCAITIHYIYKLNFFTPVHGQAPIKHKYHFVLVPEELDNDYWRLVEKGAKKAAAERGILLEYLGPEQANIEKHLTTLEMAAASKVDGIITQGLTDEQFTPLINRIVDADIPVITIDTDAPKSNRIAYIGTDNYYSGYLAGSALIHDTDGKVKVGIITGDLWTNHQQLRVKGFMDAIKSQKRISVVGIEESKITRVGAAEKAYKLMQEHPEVNAFYGTSALDGIGIAQVAEQLSKKPYIIGYDTLPETVVYMEKGIIRATVTQKPFEMGYGAVQMMVEAIHGKAVAPIKHTSTTILRKSDLHKIMPQEALIR
ncbi:sugar-binding protein [Peribacillus sp. SCS-155]|uniref:sugar-binding protein n=1 Tax=Peribacillus sedimenti TaxID=3115297 RepID=UPI003905E339